MRPTRWIDSRHGFRLSKADGTTTKVLCGAHKYWHPQKVRLANGKLVDGRCPICISDYQDLKYGAQQLGIPVSEATRPANLARIEARLGKQLMRYQTRG